MASSSIPDALAEINGRILRACADARRDPNQVRLIAVSKKASVERLAEALAAGQADFGESYLQEALPKIAALPRARITWHFIGPIQGNKAADIAGHFDWAHSVDRVKIAQRLSAHRPPDRPPLNVCVQVNISGEASKSGVPPEQARALCEEVVALPRLRLRGLMAIPARQPASQGGTDAAFASARTPYNRLRKLFDSLREGGLHLDTLSAGMTDDFKAAIAEGSTLIRIGTAIFGRS